MDGIRECATDLKKKLSAVITTLKVNVIGPENRVHVRRKKLWEDFLHARKTSQWFKPDGVLRVLFTGEPAVDGGGPKRVFHWLVNFYHHAQ